MSLYCLSLDDSVSIGYAVVNKSESTGYDSPSTSYDLKSTSYAVGSHSRSTSYPASTSYEAGSLSRSTSYPASTSYEAGANKPMHATCEYYMKFLCKNILWFKPTTKPVHTINYNSCDCGPLYVAALVSALYWIYKCHA